MGRNRTVILAASILAAGIVTGINPTPARAQWASGYFLVFGVPAMGAVDLALSAEVIEKATHGHGMYTGGAVFEIIWGTLHLVPALLFFADSFYPHAENLAVGGAAFALMGGYLVSHGFWSLTSGRPERGPGLSVSVSPTRGGAMLGLGGQF